MKKHLIILNIKFIELKMIFTDDYLLDKFGIWSEIQTHFDIALHNLYNESLQN